MKYWKPSELLEGIEKELIKYCDKQGYEQQTFDVQFQIEIIPNAIPDMGVSDILDIFSSHFFFFQPKDSRPWHNPFTFYIIDQKKKCKIFMIFENKEEMCWEIREPK